MEIRKIDEIVIGDRHRKDMGDLDGLAASMADLGLLHPPVILADNTLVVGHRRIQAAKKLGWDEIPVNVVATLDDAFRLLKAEADENTCRKDFSLSEAVAIGESLRPSFEAMAKAEQEAGQKKGGGDRRSQKAKDRSSATCTKANGQDHAKRTNAMIGAVVGLGSRSYEKAVEVVESGNSKLIADMERTGKVNGVYKRLKTLEAAEEIAKEPPPLPTGPFRVIVADPPWQYENRPDDPAHRAANPYPSMSVTEIAAMPVRDIAHKDSILWLWVTNSHLPEVWGIVDAWGFTYKTMLTWAKDRMGTGDWLRGQTEHCLLCVRGKPTIVLTNQTTLLHGPLREHSQKPDEFFGLVEAMCPGSKVELFCREPRPGWEVFGNEV